MDGQPHVSMVPESPSTAREARDHVGGLPAYSLNKRDSGAAVNSGGRSMSSSVEVCGGYCFISNATASWVFAFLAILGGVGVNVTLPLFSNSVGKAGPYFVLLYGSFWFALVFFALFYLIKAFTNQIRPENTYLASTHRNMFYVGLMTSLNGLLIVFASPTDRTPGFLQALLVNITIPMTIAFRYAILGKGVNWKQTVAATVVMAGIFIALVPSVFGSSSSDAKGADSESSLARILWPVCFMVGFAPGSIQTVVTEKGLKPQELEERTRLLQQEAFEGEKAVLDGSPSRVVNIGIEHPNDLKRKSKSKSRGRSSARSLSRAGSTALAQQLPAPSVHLMYFMAWTNLYQFVCNVALWWADLIPDFGMATASTFFDGLVFGVKCLAAAVPECDDGGATTRAVIFIACFMFSAVASGLLVRQSEGANYVALVGSATTPIAALFWTLFAPDPLRFDPAFTTTTWYSLGGLVVMIPGIIYYNKHSEEGGAH